MNAQEQRYPEAQKKDTEEIIVQVLGPKKYIMFLVTKAQWTYFSLLNVLTVNLKIKLFWDLLKSHQRNPTAALKVKYF